MRTTAATAARIFDTFAQRDEFLGFGYIGERRNFADSDEWTGAELARREELVARADAVVLETVTREEWTIDELFAWGNSKDGRWFADCALGCADLTMATRYLRRQR